MAATNYAPTATPYNGSAVSAPVDGDGVSRDNLYVEASPGGTKKLTLALLLDYITALFHPTVSARGSLSADETLVLGSQEYTYGDPTAARIVTLPAGTYVNQQILVRGTNATPTYAIAFKYSGATLITFVSGKMTWGELRWNGSAWAVVRWGAV